MAPESENVVVYCKPRCPFAAKLRFRLKVAGIPYLAVSMASDPDGAARVRSVNDGNEISPTVWIGDHYLTNPTLGEVREAIAGH
jgi:mycoredoxin